MKTTVCLVVAALILLNTIAGCRAKGEPISPPNIPSAAQEAAKNNPITQSMHSNLQSDSSSSGLEEVHAGRAGTR